MMWSPNITLKLYSKLSPEGARSVTFSSSALISSFKNFSELTYGGLSEIAKETYDHDQMMYLSSVRSCSIAHKFMIDERSEFVLVCVLPFSRSVLLLNDFFQVANFNMWLLPPCRRGLPSMMAARQFHATTQVSMRKKLSKASKADDEEILQHFQPDGGLDVPVAGYLLHRQQRQTLYYMRLTEHEIPKLVGQP